MYSLQKPSEAELRELVKKARSKPLNTSKKPLEEEPQYRWNDDYYRREILFPNTSNPAKIKARVEHLMRTCEFFPEWMVSLRVDDLVIVGAKLLGVWGVFADRVIEEHNGGDEHRFDIGFTYATVKGHFETGIESFRATRADANAPVIFEIRAISRADNPAKQVLSSLFVRDLQRKFGKDTPVMFERQLRMENG